MNSQFNQLIKSFLLCICASGFLVSSSLAQTGKTVWYDDLDQAKQVAAKENKVVMLHFWATWCQPCKNLDKFVFGNPGVARALEENVIAVKVNVDHRPDLAKKYKVASIPSEVVINAEGVPLGKRSSPNTADAYLKMVGSFSKLLKSDSASKAITASTAPLKTDSYQSEAGQAMDSAMGRVLGESGQFNPNPTNPIARDDGLAENAGLGGGGRFNSSVDTASHAFSNPKSFTPEPNLYGEEVINNASLAVKNRLDTSSGLATPEVLNQQAKNSNRLDQELTRNREAADRLLSESRKARSDIKSGFVSNTTMGDFAIEGYCPVTLVNKEKWEKGDSRWGCKHRGKTYIFSSKENRDLFRMAPDAFSPLLAGFDPVLFQEQGALVAGKRKHGAFFGGNEGPKIVVLFQDMVTRTKFEAEPAKYIQTVRQAMNQTDRNTTYR